MEDRAYRKPTVLVDPLLQLIDDFLDVGKLVPKDQRSGLSNVLEGPALFVVDNNSLLLALEYLVVLLKLFASEGEGVVTDLAADAAAYFVLRSHCIQFCFQFGLL